MSYEKFYPNGWQSGEAGRTPITPEALDHIEEGIAQAYRDLAPAGYGLGGICTFKNDPDDALETGYYAVLNDSKMPANHWWIGYVTKYSDAYVIQHFTRLLTGESIQRLMLDGVWQPFEWENPFMYPGVEYRTTERWNGNPVYTKLIDCGAAANEKVITFTDDSGNEVFYAGIRCAGKIGTAPVPAIWGSPAATTAYANMYCDGWSVRIFCSDSTDFVGKQCYCQIWYIKD